MDVGIGDLDPDTDADLIKQLREELGFVGSDEPAYRDLPGIDD